MFVRDFIYVGQPFEVAAPRLVADKSWLAPLAETAAATARAMAVQLRSQDPTASVAAGPRHHGPFRCEVGPVRARVGSILVPLWLYGEHEDDGFPDLTGDLEVAPVDTSRSVIELEATYPRPTFERESLHRIERATQAGVRSFLKGIATVLSRPADD